MLRSVPLGHLRSGSVLSAPIYDPATSAKLLGAGVEVTNALLDRLRKRGVRAVVADARDIAMLQAMKPQGIADEVQPHSPVPTTALQNDVSAELDAAPCDGDDSRIRLRAIAGTRPTPSRKVYSASLISDFVKQQNHSLDYLDGLQRSMLAGTTADVDGLAGVSQTFARLADDDRDLFVCLGVNPFDSDYPARHSLHVALLMTAMGLNAGWDEQLVLDAATGCLIHDVGMQPLSEACNAKRRLSPGELRDLANHPLAALERVRDNHRDLPLASRMVVYQTHERSDGSGYPRGRRNHQIHPAARLAAVADTFIGLVSNRPHRPGCMPYRAMETILQDARGGKLDVEAVRLLLATTSLFPIGSFVLLSDGRVGRVIRATEDYTRPIVEAWKPGMRYKADVVDLHSDREISIRRAVKKAN